MKNLLALGILLLVSTTTQLRAETEDEFVARVTAAYDSKDSKKVLALYSDISPETARNRATRLENEFKTCRLKSVQMIPFSWVPDLTPNINEGSIAYPAGTSRSVVLTRVPLAGGAGTTTSVIQVAWKNDAFSLVAPTVDKIEWNGPQPSRYTFSMDRGGHPSLAGTIAVVEIYGLTTWANIGGGACLRAHKVIQLITPPVKDLQSVTFEIAKDDNKSFFKRTVDTSKGALMPVEAATP